MGQELDLGLQNSFLIFLMLVGKKRSRLATSSCFNHEASTDVSLLFAVPGVGTLRGDFVI